MVILIRQGNTQEYAEFITAESSDEIIFIESFPENFSDSSKHLVPVCVTKCIIYSLEIINVKEYQRMVLSFRKLFYSIFGKFFK